MKYVKFTPEEKIQLFDKIAALYYEQNFGRLSKADMELLMFQFYIEKLIKGNRDEDGTINYSKCSDYIISKELGITQQRVRNLKVKNQLIHPIDYDWKAELAKLTRNARFDPVSRKVTLNIPDPNLYLEIQNFIEEQGAYVEKQLNNKILQIRAEYYLALIINLEPEKKQKVIVNELHKRFNDANIKDAIFDERNIGKSLIDGAVDLTTIVANIYSIVSPENYVAASLIHLLKQYLK